MAKRPAIYRFGDCVLDPASRRLLRQQREAETPRRVFDLILYLIEHRERAISRDELIRQAWGRDNVSDNQLAQTVLAARRLLDDDGSAQRLIRTVPGFGYHWVAEVEVDSEPDAADAAAPPASVRLAAVASVHDDAATVAAAHAASPRSRTVWFAWSMAGLMLLAAASGLYPWFGQERVLGGGAVDGHPSAETDLARDSGGEGVLRVWVLPASVPDDDPEIGWARVGLMAIVSEHLRGSGMVVVPVENVLLRVGDAASAGRDRLRRDVAGDLLVDAAAAQQHGLWQVTLRADLRDRGIAEARTEDADLLLAARAASAELARQLGAPARHADVASNARFELIRLALRSNDLAAAEAYLARLPEALRQTAEAGLLEVEFDYARGQLASARARVDAIVDAQPALPTPLQGRVLIVRSELGRRLREPDWGRDIDAAVALLETAAAPRELATAMQARAMRAVAAGDPAAGAIDFLRARRLFLDAGDEIGAATADANLARLAVLAGRPEDALHQLERSAAIFQRYGAVAREFNARLTMVGVQQLLLRWEEALAASDRVQALLPGVPDPAARSLHIARRATLMVAIGRLEDAARLIDALDREAEAVALREEEQDLAAQLRARLLLARDQPEAAMVHAARAFAGQHARHPGQSASYAPDIDSRDQSLLLWLEAAFAVQQRGGMPAPIVLDGAQQAVIDAPSQVFGLVARGRWLAHVGEAVAAEEALRRALVLAEESHRLARILEATGALTELLIAQRRLEEAETLLDRLHARNPDLLARDFGAAQLTLALRHAQASPAAWQQSIKHARALAGERSLPRSLEQEPAAITMR